MNRDNENENEFESEEESEEENEDESLEESEEESLEENEEDIINEFLSLNIEESGVLQANKLWKELFHGWSKQHIIVSVISFFREIPQSEPLFYHIIANPSLIDELRMILNEFVNRLKVDKIITNVVDGWEDFFIKTNYAVTFFQETGERHIGMTDEYEIMETYRQIIRDCIVFLLPYLGEEHCLNSFYQRKLFEMFFIRL